MIARIVYQLFCLLFLGFMLTDCAHVAPVVNTVCKALPSDTDAALGALQGDAWQTALDALKVARGLCVARAAVQQVIDALSGGLALSTVDSGAPSNAEVVSRGRAWLTANPN